MQARARVVYAMAAACAAAIASLIAIREMSLETRVPLDTAGSITTPVPHATSISRTASVAMERGPTRVGGAPAFALTPDTIERAVADAPLNRRDLVLSELLAQLVAYDASAAGRIAESEAAGYLREVALRVVAQNWAKRDAAAALHWAVSLGDQDERDAALANVALELAVSQPLLALQGLSRRSVPRSPDPALEGVAQQWATTDFAAAHAWADAQPAGPGRDALLMRLLFVRVEQSPADAARLANIVFSNDAQRIDAISTIALRWGAQDPSAAREWALTLDAKAQQRVQAELALLE